MKITENPKPLQNPLQSLSMPALNRRSFLLTGMALAAGRTLSGAENINSELKIDDLLKDLTAPIYSVRRKAHNALSELINSTPVTKENYQLWLRRLDLRKFNDAEYRERAGLLRDDLRERFNDFAFDTITLSNPKTWTVNPEKLDTVLKEWERQTGIFLHWNLSAEEAEINTIKNSKITPDFEGKEPWKALIDSIHQITDKCFIRVTDSRNVNIELTETSVHKLSKGPHLCELSFFYWPECWPGIQAQVRSQALPGYVYYEDQRTGKENTVVFTLNGSDKNINSPTFHHIMSDHGYRYFVDVLSQNFASRKIDLTLQFNYRTFFPEIRKVSYLEGQFSFKQITAGLKEASKNLRHEG